LLANAYVSYKIGRTYSFCRSLGKFEKLYESAILNGSLPLLYRFLVDVRTRFLEVSRDDISNPILDSFLRTNRARKIRQMYRKFGIENAVRIRYLNEDDNDREGNLLILSTPKTDGTGAIVKGVLYLQYNNSIEEFAALFDLSELYREYVLVVEPSSWGYSDLGLELLLSGQSNIYVMAQDKIDFDLITLLDSRIVPIRAGAGDWIDLEMLRNHYESETKNFDVCMVASWRKLKNHKILFRELAKLGKGLRIALVGYCWEGRTAGSIRKEQYKYYPDSLVSIFEGVPHEYVFKVLSQSRVALMLSEREGANRGIYEAVASNIPVVILSDNRGVNKQLEEIGCIFSADRKDLRRCVEKLLKSPLTYSVKDRLFSTSGTQNTWKKIGDSLSENESISWYGEPIIVSTPNLKYRDERNKRLMDRHYKVLEDLIIVN
jgi:glycosyltransferase involved in cell wall biosynthesis